MNKCLSVALYIGMIITVLDILTLGAGFLMKTTDLFSWEIVFYCMVGSIGLCNFLSVVLYYVGIRQLEKEDDIEISIDEQDEDR